MTEKPTVLYDETPHQRAERLVADLNASQFCLGALINAIETTANPSQRQMIIEKLNKKLDNAHTVSHMIDTAHASAALKQVIAALTPDTPAKTPPYPRAAPSQTAPDSGSDESGTE